MKVVVLSPPTAVPREIDRLHEMFNQGLRTYHLRKPGWTCADYSQYLSSLSPTERRHVMLHDCHHLAQTYGCKGTHYTERARPASPIMRTGSMCVSTSLHDLQQLKQTYGDLDYAFLSPIYDSISKTGYQAALFDKEHLQAHLLRTPFPVVALGGVSQDKVAELAGLGFAGAALLGSVWQSEDPGAAVRTALRAAEQVGS